jgi:hypothetical protein
MSIHYIDPLSRALGRMKKALFKPFDIGKWFTLGFTAFLAGLTDCHHGKGSSDSKGVKVHDLSDIVDFPRNAWEWLLDHPGWFTLIVFGVLFLIALVILLTWLSSRGKFMFLDNVVHERAKVIKPWHEFRILGNSLFLWRLCFGLICLVLFIMFLVFCYGIFVSLYESYAPRHTVILAIVGMVLSVLLMLIIKAYISLFLNDFVAPIMYKNNAKIIQAWSRFLSLFSNHLLYFIFYGLLVFLLHILVIICVIIAGLLTCCIGLILLIIPYIGSVITLPISYTFRAFSLEFLGQFGPEFTVLPPSEDSSVSASGSTNAV